MTSMLRNLTFALGLALIAPGCAVDVEPETGDEQNATAASGTFETFVGDDGKTYFHLLAKNGERVLASQAYKSPSSAKTGIKSVITNGKVEANFDVFPADNGEFYFNLVAGNGKVIGTSETYATEAAAKKGVQAVVKALQSPSTTAAETGARFQTFKGQDGKTYFRLRADNGQIVLQSQGYSSKSSADKGIASVKLNGVDATHFTLVEGVDGQHTFHLEAQNGKIIGRGEMYASKSNAVLGADRVRDVLRDMAGAGAPSDDEIRQEIEQAGEGLFYTSESDYPFGFVSAPSAPQAAAITEALVREELASFVDGDEDADKPMADLVAMERTWQQWKDAEHNCADLEDPLGLESCMKMRDLEQVLEANLTDLHVFYFGADGAPGDVEGTGVSIFIVGRTPEGTLAGVRTLAIWT